MKGHGIGTMARKQEEQSNELAGLAGCVATRSRGASLDSNGQQLTIMFIALSLALVVIAT